MDPNASGVHTSRSACEADRCRSISSNVLMLNSSVPASCTTAAHQSMRCGSHVMRCRCSAMPASGGVRGAFATSRYWRAPAAVKNRDPTKKVMPSTATPTALT
jgi:hypothetical protein